MKKEDLAGQRFGRLTVTKELPKVGRKTFWLCLCDCGKTKEAIAYNLKNGNTKSCGCLQKEVSGNKKHGLLSSDKKNMRLFVAWCSMKARCNNPQRKDYKNYGGRGIQVCAEWINDFSAFHSWATDNGYSDELTIDRIDVNGNYEPSNCRWATIQEQQKNKRTNK